MSTGFFFRPAFEVRELLRARRLAEGRGGGGGGGDKDEDKVASAAPGGRTGSPVAATAAPLAAPLLLVVVATGEDGSFRSSSPTFTESPPLPTSDPTLSSPDLSSNEPASASSPSLSSSAPPIGAAGSASASGPFFGAPFTAKGGSCFPSARPLSSATVAVSAVASVSSPICGSASLVDGSVVGSRTKEEVSSILILERFDVDKQRNERDRRGSESINHKQRPTHGAAFCLSKKTHTRKEGHRQRGLNCTPPRGRSVRTFQLKVTATVVRGRRKTSSESE
jgi:hypothetical protein